MVSDEDARVSYLLLTLQSYTILVLVLLKQSQAYTLVEEQNNTATDVSQIPQSEILQVLLFANKDYF